MFNEPEHAEAILNSELNRKKSSETCGAVFQGESTFLTVAGSDVSERQMEELSRVEA